MCSYKISHVLVKKAYIIVLPIHKVLCRLSGFFDIIYAYILISCLEPKS
jgi:hypothetical protein